MYSENKEEIEIDLIRMMRFVLSCYRKILPFGIVFAVLFFSYKFYSFNMSEIPLEEVDKLFNIERIVKQTDGRVVKENKKVSYNLYKEDYLARLSQYNNDKNTVERKKNILSTDIAKVEDEIRKLQAYIEYSKLYGTDPKDYWEAVVYYNVREKNPLQQNTPSRAIKGNTVSDAERSESKKSDLVETESSVIHFADNLLHTKKYFSKFADCLGIKIDLTTEPVSELIVMNAIDNYSFRISVKGKSQTDVKLLLNVLSDFNNELQSFFEQDYVIKSKLLSFTNTYNQQLLHLKTDKDNAMSNLNGKVEAIQTKISNLVQPIPLEDEKMIDLDLYRIKKLILFTLAGFIGGIFLGSGIYSLCYLFSGKLNDADYLCRVYGLRKIATLHEASFAKESESESRKLKEAGYLIASEYKNVVAVTTLKDGNAANATSKLVDAMNEKSVIFSLRHPEELVDINEADAVVIVEKLDVSKLKDVTSEIEMLEQYSKKILGIVYV
ncbi:MAG: hypothetical protein ACI4NE_04535 [Succinivibrio sp.]